MSQPLPRRRGFAPRYLPAAGLTAIGEAILLVALPILAASRVAPESANQAIGTVVALGSLGRMVAPVSNRLLARYGADAVVRWTVLGAVVAGVALVGLLAAGLAPLGLLAIYALVNGGASGILTTVCNASLPQLKGDLPLARANALNTAAWMGSPILGYAVGGVLATVAPVVWSVVVGVALSSALAVAARCFPGRSARSETLPHQATDDRLPRLGSLLVVIFCLGLLLNVLINAINVRAPAFLLQQSGGNALYGAFEGTLAACLLLGLAISYFGGSILRPPGAFLVCGGLAVAASAAAIRADVTTNWFVLAATIGLALGIGQVFAMTIVQEHIPDTAALARVLGWLLFANSCGLLAGSAIAATRLPSQVLLPAATGLVAVASLVLSVGVRRR